jgi:radical SAM protein with 4Fe4S-binding SPASM domain
MVFDFIEEILLDISRWETPLTEIVPVNHGEFFLYPQWWETLQLIARYLPNTQIVIPTNGALVDVAIVNRLIKIPNLKIINFSVNACFPETYKAFTGLDPSNMGRIKKAIKDIRLLRPDITCWASMVFDPLYQTDLERDRFVAYWGQFAIPQIIPAANCNRKPQDIVNNLPCRSIFSDLVIGYDGKLTSCCFDANFTMDLGYWEGSILEAWRNPKLEELRRMHNEGRRIDIPFCRGCSFA